MKVNRHAKIVELINKYQIETQEELADYLNQNGFRVTQATVSRDIRDLKLTKVPADNGKQKIVHEQEIPEFRQEYILPADTPINAKVYVIDDGDHSTMLLAEEY